MPRPFEAIVAKLLAKNPDLRYADADALRDDLRRFRTGEPVMALAGIAPNGPPAAAVSTVAMPRTTAVPASAVQSTYPRATAAAARTTAMAPTGQRPVQQQPVQYSPPNRNGLYAVLGFIAVIALVVGGILLYNSLTEKEEVIEPTTVAVPNVVGKTMEEASKMLADAGLAVTPVAQENAEVPEDQVFQTMPPAETIVDLDSAVEVYFNPIKEPQPVPDVTGENLEEAKRILTEEGFVVGEVTSENSELPKDTVIRTNPVANESLKVGLAGGDRAVGRARHADDPQRRGPVATGRAAAARGRSVQLRRQRHDREQRHGRHGRRHPHRASGQRRAGAGLADHDRGLERRPAGAGAGGRRPDRGAGQEPAHLEGADRQRRLRRRGCRATRTTAGSSHRTPMPTRWSTRARPWA